MTSDIVFTADFADVEAKMAALLLRYSGTTWATYMSPTVERPVPLDRVGQWWASVYDWRSFLWLSSSSGANMYDGNPETRVPHSTIRTKFPWLTVEDMVEVERLTLALRPPRQHSPISSRRRGAQ